jgi:hypothetical protein
VSIDLVFIVNKTAAINSTCSGVSITVTKVSLGQLSCDVTEIACQSSLLLPFMFKLAACSFKTYVLRFKTYIWRFKTYVLPRPMSCFGNETDMFWRFEWACFVKGFYISNSHVYKEQGLL